MVGLAGDDLVERALAGACAAGEVGVPVDARRELVEPGPVEQRVGLDGVAVGDLVPVRGRDAGLERHDPVGGSGRLVTGIHAGEGEHPRDVRRVCRPDRLVLRLAVVGLVGQADAGLLEVDDVAGGVTVVGVDDGVDQPVDAGAQEPAEERHDVLGRETPCDGLEERGERLDPALLDPRLVHERAVEVADLAGDACRPPARPRRRR